MEPVLDDRRSAILRAIVEEHIATSQPVSSSAVNERCSLGVSSATIRNDMALLEREGFIAAPHTSSGRIPSDAGYRYFVDHHATHDTLASQDLVAITTFFEDRAGRVEAFLFDTARLVSKLTMLATIVVAPQFEDAKLASIHVTMLSPRRLLIVLVTRSGRVSQVPVASRAPLAHDRMPAANAILGELLVGTHDWLAPRDVPNIADEEVEDIVALVVGGLAEVGESVRELYLDGAASLAERFEAIDDVLGLLRFFDQRSRVIELLEAATKFGTGVTVRIGSELPAADLQHASMVIAPFHWGDAFGMLGVVGPTRMNYSRVMSAVHTVSDRLEHTLMD